MKTKLFLCAAALALAGCASGPAHYAPIAEQTYTYDWVPEPLPDLTANQINALFEKPAPRAPSAVIYDSTTGAAIVPVQPIPAQ